MKTHRILTAALALSAGALLAGCERPSADVTDIGETIAQERGCVACHGLNGKGTGPTFPNINGQWRSYLREQLIKYRDGTRVNVIMNGQVSELTDRDIDILARYYSEQ